MTAVEQARRALALARTEATIRHAIKTAPPLDADTIRRLRDLILPLPAGRPSTSDGALAESTSDGGT